MRLRTRSPIVLAGLVLLGLHVPPLQASTFVRAGLANLTTGHRAIAVGEVVSVESYWNDESTFILTDVRLRVSDPIKGVTRNDELTLTLPGGSVGDLSTLIVGGAHLEIGNSYLVFADRANLPGAKGVWTIREHCQGVFDIVETRGQRLAVSQAAGHPLLADAEGKSQAPGGAEGLPVDLLVEEIQLLLAGDAEVDR